MSSFYRWFYSLTREERERFLKLVDLVDFVLPIFVTFGLVALFCVEFFA